MLWDAATGAALRTFKAYRPCTFFERRVLPTYTPGDLLTVEIVLGSTCGGALAAISMREVFPAGWTFVSSAGPNDPVLKPVLGDSSPFEFLWIAVPPFPATFTYVVRVPADADGAQQVSGEIEYRLAGGALYSDVVISEIAPEP